MKLIPSDQRGLKLPDKHSQIKMSAIELASVLAEYLYENNFVNKKAIAKTQKSLGLLMEPIIMAWAEAAIHRMAAHYQKMKALIAEEKKNAS